MSRNKRKNPTRGQGQPVPGSPIRKSISPLASNASATGMESLLSANESAAVIESTPLIEATKVATSNHFDTSSLSSLANPAIDPVAAQLNTIETLLKSVNAQRDQGPADFRLPSGMFDAHAAWMAAIDAKIQQFIETIQRYERERAELETQRLELQSAIEAATSHCEHQESVRTDLDWVQDKMRLDEGLERAQLEIQRLNELLQNSRDEYNSLLSFIESESRAVLESDDEADDDADTDATVPWEMERELRLEISQLHEQVDFLHGELNLARSQSATPNPEANELRLQVEYLRSQVLQARSESSNLKMQCEELVARLASLKGPSNNERTAALSWEERKRELLQQLETESNNESGENASIDAELQRILAEKNQELASREQEIRELRNLVEQQSISQNGFAIGAAAVADIVEADDIIIAERMKLREMQHEWEQKQRQSEIEMSLERAKLARERLELQDKLRELQQLQKGCGSNEGNASAEKSPTKQRGNWFARLGLKDD